jgi:hypothetical protein
LHKEKETKYNPAKKTSPRPATATERDSRTKETNQEELYE